MREHDLFDDGKTQAGTTVLTAAADNICRIPLLVADNDSTAEPRPELVHAEAVGHIGAGS